MVDAQAKPNEDVLPIVLEANRRHRLSPTAIIFIDRGFSTSPMKLMKILAWNSHGLDNPRGVCNLSDLLKREVSDLVFLQEAKVKASFFNFCKSSLGYYGCLAVDCMGRGGGLALLYKKGFQFELIYYSQSVIMVDSWSHPRGSTIFM